MLDSPNGARHDEREAHMLTRKQIETWNARLAKFRADDAAMEDLNDLVRRRETVRHDFQKLLRDFGVGAIDLSEFREQFDRRTRAEWNMFGLKGLSGAMFLNKLCKWIPNQQDAEIRLREVLELPRDVESGRAQLRVFHDWLTALFDKGVTTRAVIQPARGNFLISGCWNVRDRNWPVSFESARRMLRRDGLLEPGGDPVENYWRFYEVFIQLMKVLDVDAWTLEQLCDHPNKSGRADRPKVEEAEVEEPTRRVWLIAPGRGASEWERFYREGIIGIGWDFLGSLEQYADADAIRAAIKSHQDRDQEPRNIALGLEQFAREMQPGDLVVAKKGRTRVVGYGVVTSGYRHDASLPKLRNVRDVDWRTSGDWKVREKPFAMKTLTEISRYPKLVRQIFDAMEVDLEDEQTDEVETTESIAASYDLDRADGQLFLDRDEIVEIVELLRWKKNLVLQGPPGVGKTFAALRLAYLLNESDEPERVELVQFHQSYAYEDFVQGYRPDESGSFALRDGPFMRFCDTALQDPSNSYVLIIDEINRGNLSKIFGEIMMLIEPDKRHEKWASSLAYSREGDPRFFVPPNLFVIGTMNTADRSLALVDYALRRRFGFVELEPNLDSPKFAALLEQNGAEPALIGRIRDRVGELNRTIAGDARLGPGFAIGHSYFCQPGGEAGCDDAWYERVVRHDIEPLLREYWFDDVDHATTRAGLLLDEE